MRTGRIFYGTDLEQGKEKPAEHIIFNHDTQIYFYTLLPVNSGFKNHYSKDKHILWLNEHIRKLRAKRVTVIDLYPRFLDENNHLRAGLTKDGLHLNAIGYQVWAKILGMAVICIS